jgi:hypothetical protein
MVPSAPAPASSRGPGAKYTKISQIFLLEFPLFREARFPSFGVIAPVLNHGKKGGKRASDEGNFQKENTLLLTKRREGLCFNSTVLHLV